MEEIISDAVQMADIRDIIVEALNKNGYAVEEKTKKGHPEQFHIKPPEGKTLRLVETTQRGDPALMIHIYHGE